MVMTAQDTKQKPGYKQSEVGVIPEDWEVSKVGAEFEIQLGKMLDAEKNTGFPKPYLGNKAVQWNRIDISDLQTIAMSRSDLERFRLHHGDLLVCEGGEVGRAAIWEAPIEECYYQKALHRLRPLHGFNPRLMLALLRYWTDHGMLADYVSQTSIAHLTREKFIQVPIPIPMPNEQRAIATALSDVDALIASLDRLIAKKRDIKQATMQQLLTGKTRLPEFSKELKPAYKQTEVGVIPVEWNPYKFEQVASVRKKKVDPKRFGRYSFCVELEQIGQGSGRLIGYSTTTEESSLKAQFNLGDVLFGRLRAYLRKYWLADRDGVCSTEIWPLVPNSDIVTKQYLFQLVQTNQFIEAASSAYGTHMPRTDWNVIKNYEVSLPSPIEQQAITTVLTDMDAEIAALEQKRDKTRALKQGMMQELLTGKTRLI